MTDFYRFERELPELITDLAAAQVPDYFDDLLQRTARTRQRPAWSSLERWLPMGVVARPVLAPPVPWRSIAILAILALIAAAGAVIFVGSRPRLPEPFGPAANGSVLVSTVDGDIYLVDPVLGASKPIVVGPETDVAPTFSRDGSMFMFLRHVDTNMDAVYVANSDGSRLRQILGGQFDLSRFEWSPSGTQAAVVSMINGLHALSIVNIDGTASTTLDLGMNVVEVRWRPNRTELVFSAEKREGTAGLSYGFYVVHPDGTGLRPLLPVTTSTTDWMSPTLSPDGVRLAYARWEPVLEGRIRLLEIDTGLDRRLEFEGAAGPELHPLFSPDGSQLLFERYSPTEGYRVVVPPDYQLVVAPAEGGGPAVAIGPREPDFMEGAWTSFSPDGTKVLATYQSDKSTWLLDVTGGQGQRVSWPTFAEGSWQRLAR